MKRLFTTILACLAVVSMMAQGWPANYGGVMLQGFYWDYYNDNTPWNTWSGLETQANDLEGYIDLIWVPNSARTKNTWNLEHGYLNDMGYMPCWWLNHDNTCFGNTEQLKQMIATYKKKGIGIIEDVVINHKNGENDWCDFPKETVEGTTGTYTLDWSLADICRNDNGGYVSTMFPVSGADDTGDDFDGCRDLDHTSEHVQQNVKTYLDYLQKELGYAGFRYDMVKGYGPQYIGLYNDYAKPEFSVGEFWDNWDGTTWWINGTKLNGVVQSAAFDFPLKFLINNAFKGDFNQGALNTQGLAGSSEYQRYSVTFVDNHDTYRDGSKMSNDRHVLAANAFILSMPGTPCVFLPHWLAHKDALKRMIKARKAAGITNQSTFQNDEWNNGRGRRFLVHGDNADILLLLGDCGEYDTSGYTSVWNGDVNNWDFQMFVQDAVAGNLNKVNVDKNSGTYYQEVTVNVSPTDANTTLVYTEDGNDPTADSPAIGADGLTLTYNTVGTHTLKVGVQDGETVTDVYTYQYVVTDYEQTDITIYVRADKSPIYLYAWDSNGEQAGGWPGTKLSARKVADGQEFYYMSFPKTSADYTLNYILNQGMGTAQTADLNTGSTIFTALGDNGEDIIPLTETYANATVTDPITHDITVYVKATQGGLKLHAWNENGDLTSGDESLTDVILVKDCAWYRKTFTNQTSVSFLVYFDNIDDHKSNDYNHVTSDIFLTYNGYLNDLTDNTANYTGYTPAWYEQGEVCAFFEVPAGWNDHWYDICAYAYDGDTKFTDEWRGDKCRSLGCNARGDIIWKWTCSKGVSGEPTTIIFNCPPVDQTGDGEKTEDLRFVNGAWYSAESYKTSGKTEPISTAVAPNSEISLATLGASTTTATNWNGKTEKVAAGTSGGIMTKEFSLAAGDYTVQAIVRGTEGSALTLSAKGQSDEITLTGLDGAVSTVQTNGTVDPYDPGTNNGWHQVEVTFTLAEAEKVTVTLTSAAEEWQVGGLKVLTGITEIIPGDVNGDGEVTITDALMLLDYTKGHTPAGFIKAAADADGSGSINVSDVVAILEIILTH